MRVFDFLTTRFLTKSAARFIGLTVAMILAFVLIPQPTRLHADTAPASVACFPTCSEVDGRFLVLVPVGSGVTMAPPSIKVQILAAPGASTVSFEAFDADSNGLWDSANASALRFDVYPDGNGLANTTGTPLQSWLGSASASPSVAGVPLLPSGCSVAPSNLSNDNCWAAGNFAIDPDLSNPARLPDGSFRYTLSVTQADSAASGFNSFKLRTNGTIGLSPQAFSFWSAQTGSSNTYRDFARGIVTPGGNTGAPTQAQLLASNYDGRWEFGFSLDAPANDVALFDGDFDFGTGIGTGPGGVGCLVSDQDDIDTPNTTLLLQSFLPSIFQTSTANAIFSALTFGSFRPEAYAYGATGNALAPNCPSGQSPEADTLGLFSRPVSSAMRTAGGVGVAYQLVDPNGVAYVNTDPSGNLEWEMFRVVSNATVPVAGPFPYKLLPTDAGRTQADWVASSLPAGIYRVQIEGVDINVPDSIYLTKTALGKDPGGNPTEPSAFYTIKGQVFNDKNTDTMVSAGEPMISGVSVLIRDSSGAIVKAGLTDSQGWYSMRVKANDASNPAYSVTVSGTPLSGFQATTAPTGTQTVSVGGSTLEAQLDFGFRRLPVAVNDAYTVHKNTAFSVLSPGIEANDTNVDHVGDPLAAQMVTPTSNGSVTVQADGSFSYTPNHDFVGTDSYTYKVNDGFGDSNIATVTLTIVNDPPAARDDSYTTDENVAIVIGAPGILVNDSDPNGDSISIVSNTTTSHGTLSLNPDGSFQYTPNTGFVGIDTFTYAVTDGALNSLSATVTITVVGHPPVAVNDFASTTSGTPVTIPVLGNDSDPDHDLISVIASTNPSHGSVTLNPDGTFTYQPVDGFAGVDTFTYTITDGHGGTSTATVTITVTKRQATVQAGSGTKMYGTPTDPALTDAVLTGFAPADQAALTVSQSRVAGELVNTYVTNALLSTPGTALQNYDVIYLPGSFTITPAPLTITAENKTKTFDGAPFLGFTVTYAGFVNGDTEANLTGTLTFNGAATTAVNVGTYTGGIVPGGLTNSNYTIQYVNGTLTIDPRPAIVKANNRTKTYGDTVTFAGTEFTVSGFLGGDGVTSATLSSTGAPAAAGVAGSPYAINIGSAVGTGLSNYTITYEPGVLTVTKATVNVRANSKTITYGDPDPVFDYTYGPFPGPDGPAQVDVAPTCSADAHSGIGVFAINCGGATDDNYDFTYTPGTLTVLPKVANIVVTPASKPYDGNTTATILSCTVDVAGLGCAGVPTTGTFSNSAVQNGKTVTVATAGITLTGTGAANYTIGTRTVNPANITPILLTIKASNRSKVYGQTVTFAGTEFGTTGLISGDTVTSATLSSTGAPASATVAGSPYAINIGSAVGTGLNNYTINYQPGVLTVTPAPLTITASSHTVVAGSPVPTITPSYTGFVNGDTATSALSTLPICSTTYTTISAAGSYPTKCDSAVSSNYAISYVPGSVTVTSTPPPPPVCPVVAVNDAYAVNKNQTLTIVAKGILRNDVDPYGRGLVVGLVNGSVAKVGVATATAHGTVTVKADGSFVYKPATNYTGTDTFTYAAKSVYDNQVSNTATVTITINGHYEGDGCDHDRNRNRHKDGDRCDHDKATTRHYAGDRCSHDRGTNGHRRNDGCDHDRDTKRTPSTHYTGDGCDHERNRYGHRDGDSCSHEDDTHHHNVGDACDHERHSGSHSDGDDCEHDREMGEHKSGDECDHDRGVNGHYEGDHCEHDDHHDGDDDGGTSGCLIQGGTGAGRMTGGGTIGTSDARHGFELYCSPTAGPNNLEVNWGYGNKFHLEQLTSANCTKDPSIDAEHPSASFNTYQGTGKGRFNGIAGATASWTFTDAGEPGRRDKATIVIKNAAGQVVLSVSGYISNGNQQAHNAGSDN